MYDIEITLQGNRKKVILAKSAIKWLFKISANSNDWIEISYEEDKDELESVVEMYGECGDNLYEMLLAIEPPYSEQSLWDLSERFGIRIIARGFDSNSEEERYFDSEGDE